MSDQLFIAIDFDGTIVKHAYPHIGPPCPGAFKWMRKFQKAGALLILWTMRDDKHLKAGNGMPMGQVLTEAVDYCRGKGIEFFGINHNPTQSTWTASPKAYAHIHIDDAAFGCPLIRPPDDRPYVDWSIVGPGVLAMCEAFEKGQW